MKKFVLVILIFACSQKETPQQKAEAAVKKYVRKNAHKPSSYEPISFGKLDSIYTTEGTNYWELDVIRKNLVAQYNDARKKGMSENNVLARPRARAQVKIVLLSILPIVI